MVHITIRAFFDELSSIGLMKTAGVELHLIGYHRDPKDNPDHYPTKSHKDEDKVWKHAHASTIKTDFTHGRESYGLGKGIAVLMEQVPHAYDLTTDFCYSNKPVEKRLGKQEVEGLVKQVRKSSEKMKHEEDRELAHSFIEHADKLLAHPKFQFARFEWH